MSRKHAKPGQETSLQVCCPTRTSLYDSRQDATGNFKTPLETSVCLILIGAVTIGPRVFLGTY